MASDAFLKLDGVMGESQKDNHQGEIDILSFTWGANNGSSVGTGTGVSVGKVQVNDFSVMKMTDKSSPVLFQKCCDGSVIPTCTVTLQRQVLGVATPYLVYNFGNVYVTSINWSSTSGGDATAESMTFCFEVGTVDYTPLNDDGVPGHVFHGGWDIGRNALA